MSFTNLDYAHSYLQQGYSLLPLYWYDDAKRRCACGLKGCRSPAKHPIGQLVPKGLDDATRLEAEIERWWAMYPHANVGLVTGATSGLVVLDVDPRHGGDKTLLELIRLRGDFTKTFTVTTGGGGLHFYFQHPGGPVKNSVGLLGKGLDVRGDGGYVVAPPSSHESGCCYAVERRGDPAPLPAFIVETTRQVRHLSKGGELGENVGGLIAHGEQHDTLVSLAGSMRRRGMTGAEIFPSLWEVNKRCELPGEERAIRKIALSMDSYRPEDVSAISATAAKVEGVAADRAAEDDRELKSIAEIATETIRRIRAEISGERRPMRYGFADLDRMTGGTHRGEFTIIAARPSAGKTALAVTMTLRLECRSAIFSVEMARHPLMERYLAQVSGVDSLQIRARELSQAQLSLLDEAVITMDARGEEKKVYVTDAPRTVTQIKRALDKVENADGGAVDVVFVDYLQLLNPDTKGKGNRQEDVAFVSRELKRLAIDRDISVIALCQLNRAVEHRNNRRPVLADLRESGQLEQDADLVMMLHRAEMQQEETVSYAGTAFPSENLTELMIVKQRNGPLGSLFLQFDGPHYCFRDHTFVQETTAAIGGNGRVNRLVENGVF